MYQPPDFSLQTAIARLFARAGAPIDAETAAKYLAVAESFGPEFECAGSGDRHRYADSLVAAGVLERRTTPLFKNGIACGCMIEFRRVIPLSVAA
jgi:hypothetical protein